ncbi:MAG: TonB-dependent receptor plug domain-containing protein, partial [Pseudomonadota bacterium]
MSFRKKNAAMFAAQAALVGNAAVWANAYAQADEILVTAQKREQSLQDVPLSITAISSADIERGGIIEFTDYAVRVPNLSFAYTVSTTGGAQSIAIRGVFGTGTTGVYIDDTPLPESVDPRVVELERIEVLRGPQGTLYGARSMGGTVRLITQQPDLSEHKARTHAWVNAVEDGDFDYGVDGAVNLPIIKDVLGLRLIGYGQFQSGFYDRKASALAPVDFGVNENVDDEVLFGGQASALLSLLDGRLEINPRFLYERRDRDGRSFADIRADNRVNERLFDIDEEANEEWELGALNIRFDTGAGDIVSSTSYFDRSFDDTEDFSELSSLLFGIPPTPSIIFARVDDERFSQEARFESAFGGPFELTAGFFYQDIETRLEFPPTPVPGVSPNIFRQILNTKIEEAAAFGEGSLRLTDRLQAIAGLRWFDNTVDFTGEQDGLAVF